jgi:hypothetical protein
MTSPTPSTGPPDTNFFRLDKRLQSLETKIVYIGVPTPPTTTAAPTGTCGDQPPASKA